MSLRAVILDGTLEGSGNRVGAYVAAMVKKEFPVVEEYVLRNIDIKSCEGCYGCFYRTPGLCFIPDSSREIVEKMLKYELTVMLTPVQFGTFSSHLKKVIDRSLGLYLPFGTFTNRGNLKRELRYPEYRPNGIVLGIQDDAGPEEVLTFRALLKYHKFHFARLSTLILDLKTAQGLDMTGLKLAGLLEAICKKQ